MTMIPADEEIGMALVLLIVGQMDLGNKILNQRKKWEDYTNKSEINDNVWRHFDTNNVDINRKKNQSKMLHMTMIVIVMIQLIVFKKY